MLHTDYADDNIVLALEWQHRLYDDKALCGVQKMGSNSEHIKNWITLGGGTITAMVFLFI